MPVNTKLMSNLQKQYWPKKGKNVYYAMEQEKKGPFKDGNKLGKKTKKKTKK